MNESLTFAALRGANLARLPEFKNAKGEPAHSMPDGSDWALSAWCNAVLGELGEAGNIIKKIERGDISLDDARPSLAREFADVETYLDILAFRADIVLDGLVRGAPTFDDLRMRNIPHAGTAVPPLSRLCTKVLCQLGNVAHLVEGIESDRFTLWQQRWPLEAAFAGVQNALDVLALHAGVSLGAATLDKWNEVSVRVGSTVRLGFDGWHRVQL